MSYTRLGRYCLILGFAQIQPVPPKLNCAVPEDQQDPYCRLGVNPNYCQGRRVGIYQHPSFCDRFIICATAARLEVYQCRSGLGFNPYFRTCDYVGFFLCQNVFRGQVGAQIGLLQHDFAHRSNVAIDVQYNDALQKLIFAIHNNTCITRGDGNFADPTSCSHFLQCSNTRTVRSRCQRGLYFDPSKNLCDYDYNIKCVNGTRPTLPPTRTTPTLPVETDKPSENDTTTKMPEPTPRPEPTPAPPINTTTEGVTFPPTVSTEVCEGISDWKYIPDPYSCYVKITCFGGRVFSRTYCPPGLYFNIENGVCDFIRNVNCQRGKRPEIGPKPTEPAQPPATLPTRSFNIFEACLNEKNGNGNIRDPDNSRRFYVCRNYNIFGHKTCPEGYYFDNLFKQCYKPER